MDKKMDAMMKKPATDGEDTPAEGGEDAVEKILDEAEKSGALAPLDQLVKEEGLSVTGRDLLKVAQDDTRTHGKTPEELASMLRDDPGLLDDLTGGSKRVQPEPEGDSFDDLMSKKRKGVQDARDAADPDLDY